MEKVVSIELIKNKIIESINECYVEPTFTEESILKIEKFSEFILAKFHESLNMVYSHYEYVDEYIEDIIDGFYEYITCEKLESDENFVEDFTEILEMVLIEEEIE
jgi:hypothetical protein